MNQDQPDNHTGPQSVDSGGQVDRLCDAFEREWKARGRPDLAAYLERGTASSRPDLMRELVLLDITYRRSLGEVAEVDEYQARFPQYRDALDSDLFKSIDLKKCGRGGQDPEKVAVTVATQYSAMKSRSGTGTDLSGTPQRNLETHDANKSDSPVTSVIAPALYVRCPHCHNTISIVDDVVLADILCEACGSSFTLVGDEALAQHSTGGTPRRRRKIGRFEVLEQLGTGGFGAVWRARDTQLDRDVAVKTPRKGSLNEEETQKFLREARAAAQLKHPNIVSVHEVGIEDGLLFIVSDYVAGVTLNEWLRERPFSPRTAAAFCIKVARALHYAHEHGVVHRDLKPSNIMLGPENEPFIMDFGLAKREAGEVTLTIDGQILGTPAYMPPEQAKGEGHTADRRSDVYALGVILFQLLTNELPFRGNMRMLLKQVIEDDPPSPRRLNNGVPVDLETICLKCLEKSPANRYATAADLADDLARYLADESVRARPVGAIERMWRWYRRHPASSAQVAGLYSLVCGIILSVWALEGLVVYGLGIDPSTDAASALVECAACLIGVYLPLTCTGLFAIRGKLVAIWIGLLIFSIGFAFVVLGFTGTIEYSGVFRDPRLRLGMLLLLGNLLAIGSVLQGVALLSRWISNEE